MSTEAWVGIVGALLNLLVVALAGVVWQRIGRIEKKVDEIPEKISIVHARVSDTEVDIGKLQAKVEVIEDRMRGGKR